MYRLGHYVAHAATAPETPPAIEPLAGDHRFDAPEWRRAPYDLLYQSFLMVQQWWHNATSGIEGVNPRHLEVVHFAVRQMLDAASPSNFVWSNPEVARVTLEKGGRNLVDGFRNWQEDVERQILNRPPVGTEAFEVGRNVAATPGKVVFRNDLIELIQYAPTTETAALQPVLIVPAWIMKYYILDLSTENSMVRYLVSRGFTVFMVSWKNPGPEDRDKGLETYLDQGALAALKAVRAITGNPPVHGVGYCLGGTLLTMAAARLARDADPWLKTMTLFAAQADFADAGELMLFINPSQVAYLEDMMWDKGYLDTKEMAGAFQLLRSQDLIWSTMVRNYLLGERPRVNDLMAWNADATRMPYKMHSEYLRHLFLENDLAAGRFMVDGAPLNLADIRVPIFAVSTQRDHIAPWKSVFKITWLSRSDVTFTLVTGGHNAGIVAPPGEDRRSYWINTIGKDERHVDADGWLGRASRHEGSWWPAWANWLDAYMAGDPVAPPSMGNPAAGLPPLADAPGSYVRMR
jgi:polyhydroxyalkanoate synthase